MTPSALFYRSMLILGMLLIFCLSIIHAQSYKLSPGLNEAILQQREADKINIVGFMVGFQEDDNHFISAFDAYFTHMLRESRIQASASMRNGPQLRLSYKF